MKSLKLCFFLFLFSLSELNALHIIGGDLTYTCNGNNQYEFTMIVYRDCTGNSADFDSAPGSLVGTATLFLNNEVVDVITLDEPLIEQIDLENGPHPCPDDLNVCIQKGTYVFPLNLSPSQDIYTISYQRCCRNATISNIFSPQNTGMTFTINVTPEAFESCNNSPIFQQSPSPIACVNEELSLDVSAIDTENDELRYSFCAPFTGGGLAGTGNNSGSATDPNGVAPDPETAPPYAKVSFISPNFSTTAPLGEGIILNENTGIISGIPKVIGQFVFGVCVEEYKDNVLLSTIRRDFQLNVAQCDTLIAPCKPPLGSIEIFNRKELKISPNPTSAFINLSLENSLIKKVAVYNLKGQMLMQLNQIEQIDLSTLGTGIYLIEVFDDLGNSHHRKVIKS